jgi:hypothetical protein
VTVAVRLPPLGAVAGDQAVLGGAVTVGPAAAAASSALAALALLLVARPVAVLGAGPRVGTWLGALPCGLGAAALAVGPATTSAADLVVRVGASALGVAAAALVATRRGARERPDRLGVVAGAAALTLAR